MKGSFVERLKTMTIAVMFMAMSAYMLIATAIAQFTDTVDTDKVKNKVEISLEKYVNYELDGKKGSLLQFDVKTGVEYEEGEKYVPLLATGALLSAPKINNEYPESIEIIQKSTEATNGSEDGKDLKYSYNAETGEIKIAVFNLEDEEGNIYKDGKKDEKDNYSIILNYGENCYVEEIEEQEIKITGKIQTRYATEEDTRRIDDIEETVKLEKEVSNLISNDIQTSEIYNGFIKKNAEGETKYKTNYDENYKINISKKEIAEETKVSITSKFVKDGQNIETNEIVYTSTEINKNKVLEILGEDGYLKITDKDNNVLAQINKDTEASENGNVEIKYTQDVTDINVIFSKPEKVGTIEIANSKQIKDTVTDTKLEKINVSSVITSSNSQAQEITTNTVNTANIANIAANTANTTNTANELQAQTVEVYNYKQTKNVDIKDSKTTVKVNVSKAKWTNEKQNDVEFNVKLLTSEAKHNLFKNPSIEIKLPDEVEKVILEKESIIYGNGLKVTSVSYNQDTKKISLVLEGEQKEYFQNGIADGTSVTIPATIILSQDIESRNADINVAYTNAKTLENGEFKVGIEVENFKEEIQEETIITDNEFELQTVTSTANTITTEDPETTTTNEENVSTTASQTLVKRTKIALASTSAVTNTTITAQGIDMTVKPIRGDVTLANNDIVYEGEFIKYEVTLKNTTSSKIDNVSVVGSVPEGTTYAELIKDENTIGFSSYYKYDEDLKNKSISVGSIDAGKTITTYYEVRVNDLAEGETEKQILGNIKAFIGTGLASNFDVAHKVKEAEYKVTLVSQLSDRKEFVYTLKVEGEDDKEVSAKIKLPEVLKDAGIWNEYGSYVEYKISSEDNIIELNAKTNEIYRIYAELNTKDNPNAITSETTAIATVNNKYKSNQNRTIVEVKTFSIEMSSNNEGEEINSGDDIEYEIKVTNTGKFNHETEDSSTNVIVKGVKSDEIQIQELTYSNFKFDTEKEGYVEEPIERNTSLIDLNLEIPYKKSITIKVKATADLVTEKTKVGMYATVYEDAISIQYNGQESTIESSFKPQKSNEITHTLVSFIEDEDIEIGESIKQEEKEEQEEQDEQTEQENSDEQNKEENSVTKNDENGSDTQDIEETKSESEQTIKQEENTQDTQEIEEQFDISGIVWNDINEDGQKQDGELLLNGITTYLLNDKGEVVKNTTTNNKGKYQFTQISKGEYIVAFEYDKNIYKITKYKASGVPDESNSDVIQKTITISNESMVVGVTDTLILSNNIDNVNMGLAQNKKFDFKVDNYITKITVKKGEEKKEIEYNNVQLAKTEINAKDIEGAIVTVYYKIVVTNNGDLAGTVDKIVDFLPNGFVYTNSENSEWVKDTSGKISTTSLAKKTIEPGKSEELTLITSITLNENNVGTFNNKVEIEKVSNDYEIDETSKQNNSSQSEVIISISTGTYAFIILILILILILTILQIKLNILGKLRFRFLGLLIVLVSIVIFNPDNSKAIHFSTLSNEKRVLALSLNVDHTFHITHPHAYDTWRNVDEVSWSSISDTYTGYVRYLKENKTFHKDSRLIWREVAIYKVKYDKDGNIMYDSEGNPQRGNFKKRQRFIFQIKNNDGYNSQWFMNPTYNRTVENTIYKGLVYYDDGISGDDKVDREIWFPVEGNNGTPDTQFDRYTNDWNELRNKMDAGAFGTQLITYTSDIGDGDGLSCIYEWRPRKDMDWDNDASTYYEGISTIDKNQILTFVFVNRNFRRFYRYKDDKADNDYTHNYATGNDIENYDGFYCITPEKNGGDWVLSRGIGGTNEQMIGWYATEEAPPNIRWYSHNNGLIDSYNTKNYYFTISSNFDNMFHRDIYGDFQGDDGDDRLDGNWAKVGGKIYEDNYIDEGGKYSIYVDGSSNASYTYNSSSMNDKPQITFNKQNDVTSVTNVYKDGDYTILGSFSINDDNKYTITHGNNQNTTKSWNKPYNIEITCNDGTKLYYIKSNSYNPVEILNSNKRPMTGDFTGNQTFYIKIPTSTLFSHNGVKQVKAYVNININWKYEGIIKAHKLYLCGEYQKVLGKMEEIPVDDGGSPNENWQKVWTNFEGAIRVKKSDEIGYDENQQRLNLEGISFLVNKEGDGWVKFDSNGNFTGYYNPQGNDAWDGSQITVLKSNSSGYTNEIVGLDPNGKYAIYEIIKENEGRGYSLPVHGSQNLADYYKADYSGRWKCPYELKLCLDETSKQTDEYKELGSGKFFTSNVENERDYVAVQIHKKDELGRESEIDFTGMKFKLYNKEQSGWVHRDSNGNITYGNWNGAYELTSDSDGNTEILKRLLKGKYYICESYIPESLRDYYQLHKPFMLTSNGMVNEVGTIQDYGKYVGEQEIYKSDYAKNYGLFEFNESETTNSRDVINIRIHKENEDNKNLNGLKYKIWNDVDKCWVQVDNNGYYIDNTSIKTFSLDDKYTTFTTGEDGVNGYTKLIKRLPRYKYYSSGGTARKIMKYIIYEVSLGDYDNLYRLTTNEISYRNNGTTIQKDGILVETIDCSKTSIIEKMKTSGEKVNNIYDVYSVKNTNKQVYGALSIEKVDELTQLPLEGIGFKICYSPSGNTTQRTWLIIDNNTHKVTEETTDFAKATTIYTGSNGKTFDVLKVPLFEGESKVYHVYEVEIKGDFVLDKTNSNNTDEENKLTLQDLYTLDQKTYAERYKANSVKEAIELTKDEPIVLTKGIKNESPYTKSVVTDKNYTNAQAYISLEGNVWEDTLNGKNDEFLNHQYGTEDYDIEGIMVRLVDSTGNTVKQMTTKSNGKYYFNRVRKDKIESREYHIEFSYDGITYASVNTDLGAGTMNLSYGDKKINGITVPIENKSKATEDTDLRKKLNDAFTQVTGSGQSITYNGNSYTVNYKSVDGFVYANNTYAYDWERSKPSSDKVGKVKVTRKNNLNLNVEANINAEYISNHLQGTRTLQSIQNGFAGVKKFFFTTIPNLNLGLYQREQPDLALKKDTYAAEVSINGKKFTYKYAQNIDNAVENDIEKDYRKNVTTALGLSFGNNWIDQYNLPIHQADMEYTDTDNNKELDISITYAIALVNNSKSFYAKVNTVKEYYSSDLELETNAKVYSDMDCKNEISGAKIENRRVNSSLKLGNETDAKQYNSFDINLKDTNILLNPVTDTNGGMVKFIYIKLKLPKSSYYDFNRTSDIATLFANNEYRNHAEIGSYTIYTANSTANTMETYAGFDVDSVPNNLGQPLSTQGEDDADKAPGLKLQLAEERTLSGVVFEDKADSINLAQDILSGKLSHDEAGKVVQYTSKGAKLNIGNGKMDGEEKGIAGVDVYLVPTSLISHLDGDANYEDDFKFQNVKVSDESKLDGVLHTTTDSNGSFKFQGFIPDDYQIMYIWGKQKGGLDVAEYKSTTFKNKNTDNMKWFLYNSSGGSQGIDKSSENHDSEAADCYQERLDIDKDLAITYKDYNTVDEVTSNKTIHSWTRVLDMGVEIVGTLSGNSVDAQNNSNVEVFKEMGGNVIYEYNVSSIDLGLTQRPEQQIGINKELKRVRIIDAQDRVIVDAEIETDENGTKKFKNAEDILYTVLLPSSNTNTNGQIKSEIDKYYMPVKLEATYEVTVENTGELDFANYIFYNYGIYKNGWDNTPVTMKPDVYDYLNSNFQIDENSGFEIVSKSEYENNYENSLENINTNLKTKDTSKSKTIIEAGYERYEKLFKKEENKDEETITLPNGATITREEWEGYDLLKSVYSDWFEKISEKKTVRECKLDGNIIIKLTELSDKEYKGGDKASYKYTVTSIITSADDIKLQNDAEIVNINRNQETGSTIMKTYKELYYRGENVLVSNPTGADEDALNTEENNMLAIVIASALSVLALGIIAIKKIAKK